MYRNSSRLRGYLNKETRHTIVAPQLNIPYETLFQKNEERMNCLKAFSILIFGTRKLFLTDGLPLSLAVYVRISYIYNFLCMVRSNRITLTNFGLSKHLVRDSEMLTDRRGSLAYVSPDVLSGKFLHLFGCLLIEAKLGSLATERDSNFKEAVCCQFVLVYM